MVAVFAIFATLSILEMKQIGVGLAAAILLDATIIRLVVLPARWRSGRPRLVARPGAAARAGRSSARWWSTEPELTPVA